MLIECGCHVKSGEGLLHTGGFGLLQTVSGSGSFTVQDDAVPFSEGSVFFFRADSPPAVIRENGVCLWNRIVLDIRKYRLLAADIGGEDPLGQLFSETGCAKGTLGADAVRADSLFREVCALAENGSSRQKFLLTARILELLQLCADHMEKQTAPPHDLIFRTLSYIGENLAENLSLEQIAGAVFSDKFYLCKQFKSETGLTVFGYIRSCRIALAKQKLENSDSPIYEIVSECGFSDLSYFDAVFRRFEGVTPTEYRERARGARKTGGG